MIKYSKMTEADFDDALEMLDNPNVTKYLYFAPAPKEFYLDFFKSKLNSSENNPLLVMRDNGKFMGMIEGWPVPLLDGNYELGYQLPEHAWGKGIATKACKHMVDLLFSLGAHKLTAHCYGNNKGSLRVLQKSGFIIEGNQVDYYKTEFSFENRVVLGMAKQNYKDLVL